MEEAIKVADPDRWERHILRRHQEESAADKAEQEEVPRELAHPAVADEQATPQASAGDDDEVADLFRDLEEEEPEGFELQLLLGACVRCARGFDFRSGKGWARTGLLGSDRRPVVPSTPIARSHRDLQNLLENLCL